MSLDKELRERAASYKQREFENAKSKVTRELAKEYCWVTADVGGLFRTEPWAQLAEHFLGKVYFTQHEKEGLIDGLRSHDLKVDVGPQLVCVSWEEDPKSDLYQDPISPDD